MTRRTIQSLQTALTQISQLQTNGQLQLSNKVAFGLAKNLNKVKTIQTEAAQWQKDKIREFVVCDSHSNPILIDKEQGEGKPPIKVWQWKEGKTEQEMNEIVSTYYDEEVTFIPHKIKRDEIEIIHNIPIAFISTLDEFEIIDDTPTLKLHNGIN